MDIFGHYLWGNPQLISGMRDIPRHDSEREHADAEKHKRPTIPCAHGKAYLEPHPPAKSGAAFLRHDDQQVLPLWLVPSMLAPPMNGPLVTSPKDTDRLAWERDVSPGEEGRNELKEEWYPFRKTKTVATPMTSETPRLCASPL